MPSFLRRICTTVALAALVLVPLSPARGAAEPYTMDVVISLTGQAGLGGQVTQKVLGATADYVNRTGGIRGRPLTFAYHDDQSNPATTVQLVSQIAARPPAVLLGPTLGATCQAGAPVIKTGPVMYCFSPVLYPPKGSFVFSGSPATIAYAVAFFRYAKAMGWKRIAMITSTDASGQDSDDHFTQMIGEPENKSLGMAMVAHERFAVTDISVAAQMARIKSADPQVVIALAAGAPQGTLIRGIHDAGIEVPVYGAPGATIVAFLKQLGPSMPPQFLVPGAAVLVGMAHNAKEKAVQERARSIIQAAGLPLDALSVSAIDPTFIYVDALRAIGPDATADQVHAWIEGLHDYYGVYGQYDFRDGSQRGLSGDGIVIERWNPTTSDFTAMSSFGGRALAGAHS